MSEENDEPRPRERRGPSNYLILLALGVASLGAVAFVLLDHNPLLQQRDALRARAGTLRTESSAMHDRARAQRERADALARQLREADTDRARLRAELEAARRGAEALRAERQETESELAAVRAAQDQLRSRLQREIERGEILVHTERRGELAVELNQDVLFPVGESELNEAGRAVLRSVADSLRSFGRVIQVAGHTDSAPVVSERRERFPTNWELSTARATSVVRFLQDECGIPGERLVAAGYSQYRSIASNRTAVGRRRNRRIELTLVPR